MRHDLRPSLPGTALVVSRRGSPPPPIHLVTFHLSPVGINDQILFLRLLLEAAGVPLTIASDFRPDALNLMIEEFPPHVCEEIEKFFHETGKRVGIVTTEHLDLRNDVLYSYNEPLFSSSDDGDYISKSRTTLRVAGLMRASACSSGLLTLGDLPELVGISSLIACCPLVRLPFPPLRLDRAIARARLKPRADFVFTGSPTRFRRRILEILDSSFSLNVAALGHNQITRAKLYLAARFALNIPQYPGWQWSSPMRVFYGLCMGRLTVAPFLKEESAIDRFSLMTGQLSTEDLRSIVDGFDPEQTVERLESYDAFARARLAAFPNAFFRDWAESENLA